METEIVSTTGETTELTAPETFGQGMAFLNPSDMPDLETAEVGFNIKPDYHEFVNVGDTLRAVYNGIGTIKTKDRQVEGQYKDIPAVVLQNKDGVKLNAGASLVSQFQNLMPGCAVQITYKGKEKTKGGNEVKAYEVRLLNVPRVNLPVTLAPIAHSPQLEQPKPVAVESVNQETGEITTDIQLINPMDYDSVNYAAKAWNMEAGQAAREIAKFKLGNRVERADFIQMVQDYKVPA